MGIMKARWLLDREDPRTLLLASTFMLTAGLALGAMLVGRGLPKTVMLIWLVVTAAQVLWTGNRYLTWRRDQRSPDTSKHTEDVA